MKNVSVYFDGFINIPQIDVSFQYVKRIFFYVAILKATFITLPCKMKKVNFILLLYRIDKTNLSDRLEVTPFTLIYISLIITIQNYSYIYNNER